MELGFIDMLERSPADVIPDPDKDRPGQLNALNESSFVPPPTKTTFFK